MSTTPDGFNFDSDIDRSRTFIAVYEDVWQELKGSNALSVYMAIFRRTHPLNRSWYISQQDLAKESGLSLKTVKRQIPILVEKGLVKVTYRNIDRATGDIVESDTPAPNPKDRRHSLYRIRNFVPEEQEAPPTGQNVPTESTRGQNDPHATGQNGLHARGQNDLYARGQKDLTTYIPSHITPPIDQEREEPPQPPSGGSGLPADSLTDDAPSKPAKKASGRATNQAHELPEDWTPPAKVVEEMRQERPDVDQEHELRVFHDYWPSQPGMRSRKKDWTRTYRNWIRNARPSAQQPANGHAPKTNPDAWHGGQSFDRDPMLDALLNNRAFPAAGHHQATEQFPQFGDPTIRQINHTTNGR